MGQCCGASKKGKNVKVLNVRQDDLDEISDELKTSPDVAMAQEAVRDLPSTKKSARKIEEMTNDALDDKGLSLDAHEVLFKSKTEILEGVIGIQVAESENPKLAGLKGLPPEEYWRFLMDGKAHKDNDKHLYDRSAGYMAGMMSGLELVVDRIDEPISVDMIKDLHAAMSEHVTTEAGSGLARNFPGTLMGRKNFQEQGVKRGENGWGLCKDFTDDGMDELGELREELQEALADDPEPKINAPYFQVNMTKLGEKDVPVVTAAYQMDTETAQKAVEKLMTCTLAKYQRDVKTAGEDIDGKLDAIIDCCRKLGQIHPFKDANGRLIMFGVMTKLLLENGMPPTILSDQGLMIGLDRDELRRLIKEGQEQVNGMKDE